ncbi:Glutathione-regulated potassium-efflux system protein KefC [Dyadobacter sp. CECT 9275]|uniref:Glutathione-regulated potassium-efflux system protein KefC n=1 Tax=Dyadobacter helix TaxID=2822344 RepID=A0A916JBF3_9BACT|nr:monovalent cation:proton antiporter-2 (CPA2) family protein [Dyadobacter sp. CECT 9275]CAG4998546.1 Glutathione-regulated potassium-efflux system protein KefC [Dyadobacter sp. CECT 9275]
MSSGFLAQALVYLSAAVLCVPIAKRIGMSSVLGYLISGIVIGPFVLGFIGHEGEGIMHVAEFGVVMMLFLIGLELEPQAFWQMRKAIAGFGLSQLLGTTALLFLLFLSMGWGWTMAVSIGLALTMSSTAIVLQTLKEKGLSKTQAGEASFSVLLFQDIAVIPILAILPLLATTDIAPDAAHPSLLGSLPAWLQTIIVIGAVASIYGLGRYVVVPLLRVIAKTGLREMFTASSLLLVVAVAYLMEMVGLSPALGTFVAGVVLANSEFRHELESDIEPFKGLLLGLFFMGVGASINFQLLMDAPAQIATMVFAVIIIKFAVLFAIGRKFKLANDQNFMFAFGLSQVGEFAFVLLSFSGLLQIIDEEWLGKLTAVTAISMMTTPLLLLFNEKVIEPRFGIKQNPDEKPADTIEEQHSVIIAGFGHFGSTIGRLLRANGIEATILDNNSDQVELLRRMGFKVYYGDATRLDLLKSAGIETATLLIAAIDSPETNNDLAHTVRKHFPHIKIFARARNRFDAYELMEMGVKNIYRETLYTAVHLAVEALNEVGFRKHTATRQGQKFIQYDENAMAKLLASRHDKREHAINVRHEIEIQEKLLQNDLVTQFSVEDHSWDSNFLREVLFGKDAKVED